MSKQSLPAFRVSAVGADDTAAFVIDAHTALGAGIAFSYCGSGLLGVGDGSALGLYRFFFH